MLLFPFLALFLQITPNFSSKLEAELYKILTNGYNPLVRPVRNPKKALRVSMRVFLQQIINVDTQNQVIEVNAWLKFIWNDYRLRWNATQFEGTTSLRFPSGEHEIWQPDVLLYNSADDHFDTMYKSNIVVYHTGEINWIPPGIFKLSCKMDITMFPFDEQVFFPPFPLQMMFSMCFMMFGSWTYHGQALDLQIDADNTTAGPEADLSTYIANGEWHLLHAPARREERFYICCNEPYPTIKFFLHIRRRAVFFAFNIIIPSLVISIMTLLSFCLPAHDMSEKIGFQTTILLSVCFFLTILSETTPTSSEAIPLLGMFFSAVTFIVAMSTTFTIAVLNIRYRQYGNHRMSPLFRVVFLEFIPWMVMMRRPRFVFIKGRAMDLRSPENAECVQCASQGGDTVSVCLSEMGTYDPILMGTGGEKLGLDRKVGEGLFMPKKFENYKKKRTEMVDKTIRKCIKKVAEDEDFSEISIWLLDLLNSINNSVRKIREATDRKRHRMTVKADWKFAAMALDRLCLGIFVLLMIGSLGGIFLLTPKIEMT